MRPDWAAPLADLLARMPRDGWGLIHRRGHLRRTVPYFWEECPLSSTCGYSAAAYREAARERGYPLAFRDAVVEAADSRDGTEPELRRLILAHRGLEEGAT